MDVKISAVQAIIPEDSNIIVGQSHFIKTVEDLQEIIVSAVPGIEYGLAFSEASGPCLIRTAGNNDELVKAAADNAAAAGAGHTFYLLIKKAFPINILKAVQACGEVVNIFAATANPLQLIVAGTEQGNGILGVIDGFSPKGIEGEADKKDRKDMLRMFGYKF
ncbi:MAG: adenosine-specific kinase [Spirochaetia bacterium]|nr:adenosine-specific kinase [Spirochaetia bacterium]